MDGTNATEIDIMLIHGSRRLICSNISPMTTLPEFTKLLQKWLGDEFPENYSVSFYDKKSKRMVQLNDLEKFYFGAFFDSISFENETEGVRPLFANDDFHIKLYVSVKDSPTSSHLSNEVFAGKFQLHLDKLVAENIHSTEATISVSSDGLSWPTHNDLLQNNLFDKDLLTSSDDIQQDVESLTVGRQVSLTTNIQSQLVDHIRITHDVCPTPKRLNYVSNMGKKGKSTLAYLSGTKGPNDRGKQIRPILLIPDSVLDCLQRNHSLDLVVACVRETLKNGMRIWWIDKHNEFRTKGCTRNTPGPNPIEFPLTLDAIKKGHYILHVILTHIPCKTTEDRKGELLYSLDDATVKELHQAEHDSKSSRLVFMISCDGFRVPSTIGVSNFIQEPKSKKPTATNVNENN